MTTPGGNAQMEQEIFLHQLRKVKQLIAEENWDEVETAAPTIIASGQNLRTQGTPPDSAEHIGKSREIVALLQELTPIISERMELLQSSLTHSVNTRQLKAYSLD